MAKNKSKKTDESSIVNNAAPAAAPSAPAPAPAQGTTPVQASAAKAPAATSGVSLPESNPTEHPFTPLDNLDRTVVSFPLLQKFAQNVAEPEKIYDIIIDLNLEYRCGRDEAKELVKQLVDEMKLPPEAGIDARKSRMSEQYLFGKMTRAHIEELVRRDSKGHAAGTCVHGERSIYRIWPDFEIGALTNKSISTVKADAARNAFAAVGEGIVWAVMDSGIDGNHPHFQKYANLKLESPLRHADFTVLYKDDDVAGSDQKSEDEALVDENGHGTHVAGIIAGGVTSGIRQEAVTHEGVKTPAQEVRIVAEVRERDEMGKVLTQTLRSITEISGMAPRCKLLSLKVLDKAGKGLASNLIAAIEHVQEINGYGRRVRIHGVNLSVGYDFEPKWYACGQSPLCVEVDRLVKSGVVVVVAAGNTGYGFNQPQFAGPTAAGQALTINDPGNAELAITVGSTHRDAPHTYGVSYFSSKGPTGDGRLKPDLVAPGEKIISCAAGPRITPPPVPPAPSPSAAGAAPEPAPVAPPPAATVSAPSAPMIAPSPTAPPEPTITVAASVSPPSAASAGAPSNDAATPQQPPTSPTPDAPQPVAVVAPPAMLDVRYKEDSGTSMAAPHVSGVIAAFLSSRREYIGRPEDVKEIFLSTATDLKRVPYFQGRGLVDLMRTIQSV